MLPKTIHFCWFGKSPYPPIVKNCISSWEKHLPDYEIKRWDEKNSPIDHPVIKEALSQKKWAFAADYTRLHALYNFGGIYLDTDMEVIRSLTPLLDGLGFFGFESSKHVAVGVIGAESGSELLKNVMLEMEQSLKIKKNFTPLPIILTEILTKNGPISFNEEQLGFKLYSPEYFYPYNPFDLERKIKQLMYTDIKDSTYAIHHWDHSWKMTLADKIKNRIRKHIKI